MNLPDLIIVRLLPPRFVPDETMKGENGKKGVIAFKDYLKDFTIDAYDTAFDGKLNKPEPIGTSKVYAVPHLDNHKNNDDVNVLMTQVVQHYFKFTTVSDDVGRSTVSPPSLLHGVAAAAFRKKVLA